MFLKQARNTVITLAVFGSAGVHKIMLITKQKWLLKEFPWRVKREAIEYRSGRIDEYEKGRRWIFENESYITWKKKKKKRVECREGVLVSRAFLSDSKLLGKFRRHRRHLNASRSYSPYRAHLDFRAEMETDQLTKQEKKSKREHGEHVKKV